MATIRHHGTYLYDTTFANLLADSFDRAESDKASYHSYHEPYSHLFSNRMVSSFLEVGLFLYDDKPTTDLHAWTRAFPDARIYGADRKVNLLFSTDRISTFYVDQDKKETFDVLKNSLPGQIDIILDDASHVFEKTINTFENLYDLVAEDGVYVIEDILVEKSASDWEQGVKEIDDYFAKSGLEYEIFSTSTIRKCIDSMVLAIYK